MPDARTEKLARRLTRFLAGMGDDTQDELEALLQKAEEMSGSTGDKVAAMIAWWKHERALAGILQPSLEIQYRKTGRSALALVPFAAVGALAMVAQGAKSYSRQRTRSLIGRGPLSLLGSTRRAVAGIVTRGMGEKKSSKQIADDARNSYWFSSDRAQVVAGNEMYRDGMAATVDVWHRHGVRLIQWELSPAHDATDICDENFDVGPVPIGMPFPSGDAYPPAHPNCRCSLSIVQ